MDNLKTIIKEATRHLSKAGINNKSISLLLHIEQAQVANFLKNVPTDFYRNHTNQFVYKGFAVNLNESGIWKVAKFNALDLTSRKAAMTVIDTYLKRKFNTLK